MQGRNKQYEDELQRLLLTGLIVGLVKQGVPVEKLHELVIGNPRKQKLEKYFRSSPIGAYNNTFTTPRSLAMSYHGFFGQPARKRVCDEANEIADGRLKYLDQHLKVMDEIKNLPRFK